MKRFWFPDRIAMRQWWAFQPHLTIQETWEKTERENR
jgi:hypothetical protein